MGQDHHEHDRAEHRRDDTTEHGDPGRTLAGTQPRDGPRHGEDQDRQRPDQVDVRRGRQDGRVRQLRVLLLDRPAHGRCELAGAEVPDDRPQAEPEQHEREEEVTGRRPEAPGRGGSAAAVASRCRGAGRRGRRRGRCRPRRSLGPLLFGEHRVDPASGRVLAVLRRRAALDATRPGRRRRRGGGVPGLLTGGGVRDGTGVARRDRRPVVATHARRPPSARVGLPAASVRSSLGRENIRSSCAVTTSSTLP